MMRAAIEERGLGGLVAKSGETAAENLAADLSGEPDPGHARFDPLMELNNHFVSQAFAAGGLYLMNVDRDANPDNDGHYCPVCEFEKHGAPPGAQMIAESLDEMRAFAVDEGLVPGSQ